MGHIEKRGTRSYRSLFDSRIFPPSATTALPVTQRRASSPPALSATRQHA